MHRFTWLVGSAVVTVALWAPMVGAQEQDQRRDIGQDRRIDRRDFIGGVATSVLAAQVGIPMAVNAATDRPTPPVATGAVPPAAAPQWVRQESRG